METVAGMSTGYDMRKISRVFLDWPASMRSADDAVLRVLIRNLSINGAFVLSEQTWPADTEFNLVAEYMNFPIVARGSVLRADPDGMALEFQTIEKIGFDSLIDLLVEHAEDPDAIRLEMLEDWKLNVTIVD